MQVLFEISPVTCHYTPLVKEKRNGVSSPSPNIQLGSSKLQLTLLCVNFLLLPSVEPKVPAGIALSNTGGTNQTPMYADLSPHPMWAMTAITVPGPCVFFPEASKVYAVYISPLRTWDRES